MPFHEAIRLALHVIWSSKMKSVFSVIGVFIGVSFLIAVVTIVEGMNTYMKEQIAGNFLGANTFQLRRYPDFTPGDVSRETWREWARRPRISYEDARAAADGISVPVVTAWDSTSSAEVEYRDRSARIRVIAASEDYFEVRSWVIEFGRAFSPQEDQTGQTVVVLGSKVAEGLFEGADPIGKQIKIRGLPYRVIGVVESQGEIFGFSLDEFAVAPALSPVKRFVNPPRVVDILLVKAQSPEAMATAMGDVEAVMRSRRALRPAEENSFALETADAILDFWSNISRILFAVLPGLVSISLVVGGIVIMNIMLMSVAERTREIGNRKAIGARRREILWQFLVEAATLTFVGGAIGMVAGGVISFIISRATPIPASVPFWSVVAALSASILTGIFFGIYPAARAAPLDPVEALRYE